MLDYNDDNNDILASCSFGSGLFFHSVTYYEN